MVTRITNNIINSNTVMSSNFQIEQLEDYHFVSALNNNVNSIVNNAFVNSNDFITYSDILNRVQSVQSNVHGATNKLTSNIIQDTNTNVSTGSNVFFLGNTALSDLHIDVFLEGSYQGNTNWVYNTSNDTIQFKEEIPADSVVDISFLKEINNAKIDGQLIDIQSKKISVKDYPYLGTPHFSINFEKIVSSENKVTVEQSNTTYTINNRRQLERVSADTPRVFHDPNTGDRLGILSEGERSNFLTFAQNPVGNSTVYRTQAGTFTANAAEAPDSSNGAFRYTPGNSTAQHYWNVFGDYLPDADSTPTNFQIFCKADGYNTIGVRIGNTFNSYARATANLANGNISDINVGTATLDEFSNGWFLLNVQGNKDSYSTETDTLLINPVDDGTVMGTSYTGDGAKGMYFWHPQLELSNNRSLPIIYANDVDNSVVAADNVTFSMLNNINSDETTFKASFVNRRHTDNNITVLNLTNDLGNTVLTSNIVGNTSIDSTYNTIITISGSDAEVSHTNDTSNILISYDISDEVINKVKINSHIVLKTFDAYNRSSSASNNYFAINGTNIIDSDNLIIDVKTTSSNETVALPTLNGGVYDAIVSWGDGVSNVVSDYNDNTSHEYADAGTYTVNISGVFDAFRYNNSGDKDKLIRVLNLGNTGIDRFDYPFSGCSNLTDFIAGPNFNTSNITLGAYSAFYLCQNLEYLDINGYTFMSDYITSTFRDCDNLRYLNLADCDVTNVTSLFYAFSGAHKLQKVNFSNWNTSNVNSLYGTFYLCYDLNELDVQHFDTHKVTTLVSFIANTYKLKTANLSGWSTSNVNTLSSMARSATALQTIDLTSWDTSNATSTSFMFDGAYDLTNVYGIENFNTSKVTDTQYMFRSCYDIESLDLSNWSMSNVTNIGAMFFNCLNLSNLDISTWDTSNVVDMGDGVFYNTLLTSLDVSHFNTSKVTDMNSLFRATDCHTINVESWVTSNVANFRFMFDTSAALGNVELGHFDTSNATSMEFMFRSCNKITNANVAGWDTSKVTDMDSMFASSPTLVANLSISGWNVSNLTTATAFMTGGTLATSEYDNVLINWEAQSVQNSVTIDFGNSQYTGGGAAEAARTALINDHSWTITDGGAA